MEETVARELVMQHYRSSRHRGELPEATHTASVTNEVCGDQIQLQVVVADSLVQNAAFTGQGCTLSQSAASMTAKAIDGKSVAEVDALADAFDAMLDGGQADPTLMDLMALAGAGAFPNRRRCASLAWSAWRSIRSGIGGDDGTTDR